MFLQNPKKFWRRTAFFFLGLFKLVVGGEKKKKIQHCIYDRVVHQQ